jgi:MerR family mercuric resistance operon transcriptional regulator
MLTRGELARQAGVNPETIRVYEREGLLPRAARTVSGYRQFPAETVRRVRFVKQAQALGFSLREIRDLMALQADPQADLAELQARAAAKIAEIEAKVRKLTAMRDTLLRLTGRCPPTGPLDACPIWDCLDAEAPQAACCPPAVEGGAPAASQPKPRTTPR